MGHPGIACRIRRWCARRVVLFHSAPVDLAASVEEEFLVALHARDGGGDGFDYLPVEGLYAVGDAVDGQLVGFGVAHDSALADVAAAGFELGFNEDYGFSEGGGGG